MFGKGRPSAITTREFQSVGIARAQFCALLVADVWHGIKSVAVDSAPNKTKTILIENPMLWLSHRSRLAFGLSVDVGESNLAVCFLDNPFCNGLSGNSFSGNVAANTCRFDTNHPRKVPLLDFVCFQGSGAICLLLYRQAFR
jgi:hypothetical protein